MLPNKIQCNQTSIFLNIILFLFFIGIYFPINYILFLVLLSHDWKSTLLMFPKSFVCVMYGHEQYWTKLENVYTCTHVIIHCNFTIGLTGRILVWYNTYHTQLEIKLLKCISYKEITGMHESYEINMAI